MKQSDWVMQRPSREPGEESGKRDKMRVRGGGRIAVSDVEVTKGRKSERACN